MAFASVDALKSAVTAVSSGPSATQIATATEDAGRRSELDEELHGRVHFELQQTTQAAGIPPGPGDALFESGRLAQSSLDLAKASAARTEADREAYLAADLKNFDALTFNAWFTAYVFGNKTAMRVAEQRFRPQFLVAFDAWIATHPFTNPNAPKGPTYMPQYAQPELAQSNLLDARADHYYSLGETAGSNADGYVRTTVYLASVLFLVGISGHFRVRGARRGLVTVGGVVLAVSVVLLILAPRPPV